MKGSSGGLAGFFVDVGAAILGSSSLSSSSVVSSTSGVDGGGGGDGVPDDGGDAGSHSGASKQISTSLSLSL